MNNMTTEEEKIEDIITNSSSEVLASNVIAYRLIGYNKELTKLCMEELAKRRESGDTFDYESYIEEKIKSTDLPEVVNLKNLTSLVKMKF